MTEWQEQVITSTSYSTVLPNGLVLRLFREPGSCKEACISWRVVCPPVIVHPAKLEVVEDDLEVAKFAAIQLLKANLNKLVTSLGEIA